MAKKKINHSDKEPCDNAITPDLWAVAALDASFCGAAGMEPFARAVYPDATMDGMISELQHSIEKVQIGDMAGMEAMLVAQAQALQSVFVSLLRKGSSQEYLSHYQTFIGLAFKAQAQSRSTIQALVELKYPRQVVITKQANIANGPQQINNGAPLRAGEIGNEQTKLITEESHGTMDTGGTAPAIGVDQELETVGAIKRPENTSR